MQQGAWDGLRRVLEHAHAPRYNQTLGDRVGARELEALASFRDTLRSLPREAQREPSSRTVQFVEALRERLFCLGALPRGFDVARDFEDLPTTSRDDLAQRLEDLVPRDADLSSAIVYSTSATTGHAVIVPSHPAAMVQNLAHLEAAAAAHGVALAPTEGVPFALNATVQRETYVFATTMSGWRGAVFAKVNLAEHGWAGGARSRRQFLEEFAPTFIASEPVTLSEAIRLELPLRPKLVVSSAVHLSAAAAALVERAWNARVVDLYSTTETGPIGVTIPNVSGHVVLVPDLFVEALDADGHRVPDGARGELTVTGGRNPYLPLMRYRTGDHGRLGTVALPDGRPARVILDLEGRSPVSFVSTRGEVVGSVDIARRLRPLATFVQHALHQRADGSLELRLRPLPGVPLPREDFADTLRELFGRDARIDVVVDAGLGDAGGKVVAWRCDLARG
jgi:phenylacetate-CoA ligase